MRNTRPSRAYHKPIGQTAVPAATLSELSRSTSVVFAIPAASSIGRARSWDGQGPAIGSPCDERLHRSNPQGAGVGWAGPMAVPCEDAPCCKPTIRRSTCEAKVLWHTLARPIRSRRQSRSAHPVRCRSAGEQLHRSSSLKGSGLPPLWLGHLVPMRPGEAEVPIGQCHNVGMITPGRFTEVTAGVTATFVVRAPKTVPSVTLLLSDWCTSHGTPAHGAVIKELQSWPQSL